jgi:hypothetical protein
LAVLLPACHRSPTAPANSFRQIGSGAISELTTQQVLAVPDEATWAKVRERLVFASNDQPQPVDFAAERVVVVALGQRPTGGYSVRVESVAERGGVLEISAVEEAPGPSCLTTQALTQPFVVIAVARGNQGVSAAWSKTTRNCP